MRTPHVRLLIVSVIAVGLSVSSGCDGNSVTGPDKTTSKTPTSLSLTGPDYLMINEGADYKLEAVYEGGTREPMSADSWGCDNPAAIQIANGHAMGMASGAATVYSDCRHGRATHYVRVVPDYRGNWSGGYTWGSCTASGEFDVIRACDMIPNGTELPLMVRLSQNKDQATGTIALGDLMGDVTGVIDVPGRLALQGAMRYELEGMTATVTLSGWDTVADGDHMSGSFRQVWTISGAVGSMTSECQFSSVIRTSKSMQPLVRQSSSPARGLRELLLRLGRR